MATLTELGLEETPLTDEGLTHLPPRCRPWTG